MSATLHLLRTYEPSGRLGRDGLLVATGVFLVLTAWNLSQLIPYMISLEHAIGVDYRYFVDGAERWLETGQVYLPHQLAGPYEVIPGRDWVYPPIALYLFAPFVWLPAILWWAIPSAVIAWAIWRMRPRRWTWPLLALALWYPRGEALYFFGNTTMWIAAFVAAGLLIAWPSVLVFIKPSLAPFALVGANRRAWWIALVLLGVACVPFWDLWADYVTAMVNAETTILYSLQDLPVILAPIVAWLGRSSVAGRSNQPQMLSDGTNG